uniref:Ninjurin a n=1 Tax=Anopheles christyi TaxID=43041 RepID=A0A182KCE5_9DIPT
MALNINDGSLSPTLEQGAGLPLPEVIPNVNVYQQKKTLAQGMMDLALLSANANQLRYVLETYERHPYYIFSLIFISVSLLVQIGVGVGLIMNSRYDVNDRKEICKANKINDLITIGIFVITLVNVLISAFGVAPRAPYGLTTTPSNMTSTVEKDASAVEINIEEAAGTDMPDAGRTTDRPSISLAAPANGRNNNRSRSNSRSPSRRGKRDTEKARTDAIPLLPLPNETNIPRQEPPIAGPEMDDDDSLDNGLDLDDPENNRGIDSGFLDPIANGGSGAGRRGGRRNQTPAVPTYRPGFAPTFDADGTRVIQTTDSGQIIPDVNVYQQKKNLAQGMMDLALLSANANQLRYVLESYKRHPYFYVNLIFISTSIIAQVAVGIGLIWKSKYNIKKESDFCKADRINNLITIGIFIITLVNVLISAFGVAEPQAVA